MYIYTETTDTHRLIDFCFLIKDKGVRYDNSINLGLFCWAQYDIFDDVLTLSFGINKMKAYNNS